MGKVSNGTKQRHEQFVELGTTQVLKFGVLELSVHDRLKVRNKSDLVKSDFFRFGVLGVLAVILVYSELLVAVLLFPLRSGTSRAWRYPGL